MPRGVYDRKKKRGGRQESKLGGKPRLKLGQPDPTKAYRVDFRQTEDISVFVKAVSVDEAQELARAFLAQKRKKKATVRPGVLEYGHWPTMVGASEFNSQYQDETHETSTAWKHPVERAPIAKKAQSVDVPREVKLRFVK